MQAFFPFWSVVVGQVLCNALMLVSEQPEPFDCLYCQCLFYSMYGKGTAVMIRESRSICAGVTPTY